MHEKAWLQRQPSLKSQALVESNCRFSRHVSNRKTGTKSWDSPSFGRPINRGTCSFPACTSTGQADPAGSQPHAAPESCLRIDATSERACPGLSSLNSCVRERRLVSIVLGAAVSRQASCRACCTSRHLVLERDCLDVSHTTVAYSQALDDQSTVRGARRECKVQ